MTMLDQKPPAYVLGWANHIADRHGMPLWPVLRSIEEATGVKVEGPDGLPVGDDVMLQVVGGMDGPTAKAVIQRAQEAYASHKVATRNVCHHCGLPMRGGACEECV